MKTNQNGSNFEKRKAMWILMKKPKEWDLATGCEMLDKELTWEKAYDSLRWYIMFDGYDVIPSVFLNKQVEAKAMILGATERKRLVSFLFDEAEQTYFLDDDKLMLTKVSELLKKRKKIVQDVIKHSEEYIVLRLWLGAR